MTYLQAMILGAIQGLTEFLPISSSGHLVLGKALLDLHLPGKSFEVILHLGSLVSIAIVFWPDIMEILRSLNKRETWNYIGIIVLATVPAAIVGVLFDKQINAAFNSTHVVAISLWVTALVLLVTRWVKQGDKPIQWKNGFIIGCAQAVAIIPGISRSGSTISTAMLLGIPPKEAARFSFLMAIPAIMGAGVLTGMDVLKNPTETVSLGIGLAGFFTSLIVGWAALKWLINLISKGKFYQFSAYCFLVGIVAWMV